MDSHRHDMHSLFAQLGRPSDDAAIDQFLKEHRSLPSDVRLDEAPFWTCAEAMFLREAVLDDADWAAVVDELNAELHARH